jgi:hypothetical protein
MRKSQDWSGVSMEKSATQKNEPAENTGKKPYSKPEYRSESVFEVSALVCGKVHGTQGPCHSNPKAS